LTTEHTWPKLEWSVEKWLVKQNNESRKVVAGLYFWCFANVSDHVDCILFPLWLAEKFFDMTQPQCKQALEIYKKFVARMDRVRGFLRVAEVQKTWHNLFVFRFVIKLEVRAQCVVHSYNYAAWRLSTWSAACMWCNHLVNIDKMWWCCRHTQLCDCNIWPWAQNQSHHPAIGRWLHANTYLSLSRPTPAEMSIRI